MSGAGFSDAAQTWNARYAGDDYLFGTEPNAYLREQAHRWPAGSRLLCVADGEGRNSVWLARQGHRVDAFDVADSGVAKARRLAERANVQVAFDVADCDEWAWPQARYDGVIAVFILVGAASVAAPLAVFLLGGRSTLETLTRAREWLQRNSVMVAAAVLAAIGLILLVGGAVKL